MLDIKKIKISIGVGESAFTMKRGSFHYQQTLSEKFDLHLQEQDSSGNILTYADAEGGHRTVFHVHSIPGN